VESLLNRGKTKTKKQAVFSPKKSESKPTPAEPHSYEWFITEMKKETQGESPDHSSKEKSSPVEKDSPKEDETEYHTEDVSSQQDGYENFISQFKEEVKSENRHEPLVYGELKIEDEIEATTKIKTLKEKPVIKPESEETTLDPERITQELIHEVASKIAQEIVEKLDKETLDELIRKKIREFGV
jgi:hypothetical protein